jgi:hypothetical protein
MILSACGKRGKLEGHDPSAYPKKYPKEVNEKHKTL